MNERVRLCVRTVEKILADPILLAQHTNKGVNGKFLRVRVSTLLTGVECREAQQHFSKLEGWFHPSVRVTDYTPKRFQGSVRVTEFRLYKNKDIQQEAEEEPVESISG